MPKGNQRGPDGMGPMTGRNAGYCAGNGERMHSRLCPAGWARYHRGHRPWPKPRMGSRMGPRSGFNPEFRNGPWSYYPGHPGLWPNLTPESELEMLKEDLEILRNQMDATEKRIQEIEEKNGVEPGEQPEI